MATIVESWKQGFEEFRKRYTNAARPEDVSISLQQLVLFWATIKEQHTIGRFVLDPMDLVLVDKLYKELRDAHLRRFGELISQ
ncbi:MAG: hypothetical protein FWD69_16765 [Polyangiaceae bacterium]|nr:hypothetical protein [Polyangiaceae bacterium]